MVCGSQTFDLAELKKVTYYDGYKKDDITVQHFWEVGTLTRNFGPSGHQQSFVDINK